MEIRRLRHLVALAQEQHFARAAERVNLSQSAFSRSIQALEDEAGTLLFERAANQIRPTAPGRFLIGRAERLLADADAMISDLNSSRPRGAANWPLASDHLLAPRSSRSWSANCANAHRT